MYSLCFLSVFHMAVAATSNSVATGAQMESWGGGTVPPPPHPPLAPATVADIYILIHACEATNSIRVDEAEI